MSDEEKITVSDEQLVLFRDHLELQKQELIEQRERNRADESIEIKRINTQESIHSKDIEHAGKVLDASLEDRIGVRAFWSNQLRWVFIITLVVLLSLSTICCMAIFNGESDTVFKMVATVMTHLLSLGAGIGIDRVWINRKKTGISNNNENA